MPRSTREAARTLLAKVQEQGGYFTAKQARWKSLVRIQRRPLHFRRRRVLSSAFVALEAGGFH
jgi:hypothetical protein